LKDREELRGGIVKLLRYAPSFVASYEEQMLDSRFIADVPRVERIRACASGSSPEFVPRIVGHGFTAPGSDRSYEIDRRKSLILFNKNFFRYTQS
jgi:hypothetical protein